MGVNSYTKNEFNSFDALQGWLPDSALEEDWPLASTEALKPQSPKSEGAGLTFVCFSQSGCPGTVASLQNY